ncbi:MAG: alpha amylase family protein [Chitinophagaceae bacterium]
MKKCLLALGMFLGSFLCFAQEKKILWVDATANFKRFSFADSIRHYVLLSRDAGVTDLVIDVKPISGEVLYPSKIAPVMTEWGGFSRDAGFDPLKIFLAEAKRSGMKVHASMNVFAEGHNYFDRGPVFNGKAHWQSMNYTPDGIVPISTLKNKYSAMVNPAHPEVQAYELSVLKELVRMYPTLDGVILDRARYDGIQGDFSPLSRKMFEAYAGKKLDRFPEDIFSYDSGSGKPVRKEGPQYKKWLEWRASVIYGFFSKAREQVKKLNPSIAFATYTGAWYNTYYEVGVNWASNTYDPSKEYDWATPEYKQYGYAELLDFLMTGCYFYEVSKAEVEASNKIKAARLEAGMEQKRDPVYSVQGSAALSMRLVKGRIPVYAGLYVEQYVENGEQFEKAVEMCRRESNGAMIFDLVHLVQKGWWKYMKNGLQ